MHAIWPCPSNQPLKTAGSTVALVFLMVPTQNLPVIVMHNGGGTAEVGLCSLDKCVRGTKTAHFFSKEKRRYSSVVEN